MASLIYLNKDQVNIFVENGIPLDTLTYETLKQNLSDVDYNRLNKITFNLLAPGNLLNNLGLADIEYDNLKDEWINDELVLPSIRSLTENNFTIKALFNPKIIIIYEDIVDNNNSMSASTRPRQVMLENIVKSMLLTLDFDSIKFSSPFIWYFNQAF